jgi:hypothetical protein
MAIEESLQPVEKPTYISDSSVRYKGESKINTYRRAARIVGALFLIAMVASLLGGGFVESVIAAPDYLNAVSENETQVITGVLLELINGIAVLGIGVLMFPILRRHNETIALGYLGFRIIESVFCSVIIISPLSLITFSQEYLKAGASDTSYYQSLGNLAIAARSNVVGLLIPVFFSLGALLFYYLLYQSKLIPRFVSVWGFIGAVLILTLNLLLTSNLLEAGIATGLIFALPIMTNEIFIAIWLIVKGFNSSAIASVSARPV